jgi:hypothetical protein
MGIEWSIAATFLSAPVGSRELNVLAIALSY